MENKDFCGILSYVIDIMHNGFYESANDEPIKFIKENDLEDKMEALFEYLIGEKPSIENIKYMGSGKHSLVLKLISNNENYIIKLGGKREKYAVPYSPNIIQPILREEIKTEKGGIFTLEVQKETEVQKEDMVEVIVDDEVVGKICEDLKNEEIKWDDPGVRNIGRLKDGDDNKRVIPAGYGGYEDDGGLNNKDTKPKKYVVIDIDHIYRKGQGPDR